jgi:hypothetical protein
MLRRIISARYGAVVTFGIQLSGLVMFGLAYQLGWDFSKGIWDWRVGTGALLSLPLSALLLYLATRSNRNA